MEIKVLREAADYLIIDKPAGINSEEIPSRLLNLEGAQAHLPGFPGGNSARSAGGSSTSKESEPTFEEIPPANFYLVHRLDKETSGVLLLARNEQTRDELQELFKTRQVHKTYVALVLGNVKPITSDWIDKIERNKKGLFAVNTNGRVAKLSYKTLATSFTFKESKPTLKEARFTLLELNPVTGRTHQIRVQCKHHGYPIIGDQLYQTKESRDLGKTLGLSRQFLHAKKLEFTYHNEQIVAESQLATDLEEILGKLN
ncbi:RNA pseudouridine synthase [Candidatus Berkelbacteria bacterium]|nr:RNA pseudouridine synthase [Candidatus Berkelbacteria bacterium]